MSGRQVAGMMLAMTDKVRKLFLTSLALALAILFFSSAVSRAADSVSSSPQTAVFLPPVPAQNQPASAATPVPVQAIPRSIPMTNAPHAASPVSITSTPAAAAASMTAPPASTPVAATAATYSTPAASTAAPASATAAVSVAPPASAAMPVAPVATTPAAGASAPGVSPAAFTVTTPNRQGHLNQDHLNLDVLRENHIDQLDHHGILEGQRLFNPDHNASFLDPANWSV